jgi:zinc/manganese transport system substrate-binding protein
MAVAGCTADGQSPSSAPVIAGSATSVGSAAPPCPVEAVPVTVTVDQWGDVVEQLGGACATVTTIITGTAGDPHEYEPTSNDALAFSGARLVVINGLGYDAWADKLIDGSSPRPAVVDAGARAGRQDGDNPHVWYRPSTVDAVAVAVSQELHTLLPGASAYLDRQAAAWREAYRPVHELVDALRARSEGKGYVATEAVFDDMAAAVGLVDRTPAGYRQSAANGSEPAPGDLAAFEKVLGDHEADVLIVNTQTEGALVDQLRAQAGDAGVPTVDVTETVPPGEPTFVAWQLHQLEALDRALGGS